MVNNATAMTAAVARPKRGRPTTLALDIVHHLPGRVRLRAASLKWNVREIVRCRRQLSEIDGVISVEANRSTGSVVLKYDPAVLPPDQIAAVLGSRGIKLSNATAATAMAPVWQDAIKSRLARLLLEVLTERILVAMLVAAI